MLYEILVRSTELLAEITNTSVSGTYFTAAEDIPETVQDFEGYIAFMGDPSHSSDNTGNKERLNQVTWSGLLIGPQILTGNAFTNRANLLQYADLIGAKFNERPLLNDINMRPLAGVRQCVFAGGRVFEGPYPQSQSQIIRRQYSFTLQIEYIRFRTLSR